MNKTEFPTRHTDELFIDGLWTKPLGDARLEIVSPDDENVVASVAAASNADMDRAVDAARRAFDHGPWPRMHPSERLQLIERLIAELELRHGDLARAFSLQVGGLPHVADFLTQSGSANFRRAAELGKSFAFEEEVPSEVSAFALLVREPVGVVAAIAPWNAPYLTMSAKVAPALLAGCTIIMKPSPETPLEAIIIAECAEAAGFPPGVLNLTPADRDASDYLVHLPGVDKVTFTGSTLAGRHIASVCASRMARFTMELGGKSAAIILDDFSTDAAADILAGSISLMTGQICSMLTRVIIPRARHDALAAALSSRMAAVQVGRSDQAGSQMGPLASRRQMDRVAGYVERGVAEGARLVTGGARPTHLNRGYFLEPTLFADVDTKMSIAQEEIFGPVLSLIASEDLEDGIRIANDSQYGLNGAVFTDDAQAAYRVARQMRTGNIAQNAFKNDFSLPFGGFKQSGVGREGGREGLMSYLETKTILMDGPVTAA